MCLPMDGRVVKTITAAVHQKGLLPSVITRPMRGAERALQNGLSALQRYLRSRLCFW